MAPTPNGKPLRQKVDEVVKVQRRSQGFTQRRLSWRLLSALLDAVTIAVSVADIATDFLVLLEFRALGHRAFFVSSAGIFALSQLCYAFLFVASYAGGKRPLDRIGVFVAVLPLGQLVPLFTWLEALHLEAVDVAMRRLGLRPTSAGAESASGSDDSLWGFLQSKYQSHAGFLVEAFVEAVPQAVLQTVFAVVARQGTALNAISVAISVFTIASKGYLVSYALEGVTFLFNFLCIAADCFGLFASATILAQHGLRGPLAQAVAVLAGSGLVLSVVAGHGLLWFTILDDHLKLRAPKIWPHGVTGITSRSGRTIFFDLYIVRLVAWFLAIVPCVVLFAGARLSLIPICVLNSLDPDLVCHARFYRGLMHFLHCRGGGAPEREARLLTLNSFLAAARREEPRLWNLLSRQWQAKKQAAVRRWAAEVGAERPRPARNSSTYVGIGGTVIGRRTSGMLPVATHGSELGQEADLQQAILESLALAGPGNAATTALRWAWWARFRQVRAVAWLERQAREVLIVLQSKSEVFRGVAAGPAEGHIGHCRPGLEPRGRTDAALHALAVAALGVVALCGLPLALGHAALALLGVAFPLLHLSPGCVASSSMADGGLLPCSLTLAYATLVLSAGALAPQVAKRQLVWVDMPDLKGFPEPFYGPAVLGEIRRRHLRDSVLRQRLGYHLTQYTLSFIET